MDQHIASSLAAYFSADHVEWKPQSVSGNRALAVAYVDARCIMDRLDEVLGIAGWQDQYEPLEDGTFLCKLSVKIDGEWITKMDVGGMSDQSDGGDRRKAAVSDALKRTAVKFGIARYLYSLPLQWCDYDPKKRSFVREPSLPDWALPKPAKPVQPVLASEKQLKEVRALIGARQVALDWTRKVFERAKVASWEEMKADDVDACLKMLRGLPLKASQPPPAGLQPAPAPSEAF